MEVLIMGFVKSFGLIIVVCCLISLSSGCAVLLVGGAAGGGVAWMRGDLEHTFDYPVDAIYQTVEYALKQMGLPKLSEQQDELSAKVVSKFADGKKVIILIKAMTADSCRISIRVGSFGDRERSVMIFNNITSKLY